MIPVLDFKHMNYSKPIKLLFTDFWDPVTKETCQNNCLYRLLSKHFNIVLSDDPDFLIYCCFGLDYLDYDCPRIFFSCESVRPNWNRCDYAFSCYYPETERNYRLPWYRMYETEFESLFKPRNVDKIVAEKTKFCACLISNPNAMERLIFLNKLSKYKRVDSGGAVANNIGYQVENEVVGKMAFLRNYKFSMAFENSQHAGYTTEKLMQSLVGDTIPIYWGDPDVAQDFNPAAFINCNDYPSFNAVIEVVKEIDQNEKLYRHYLSQSRFLNNTANECTNEDRIIEKFDRIFSSNKVFIPASVKRGQRKLKKLHPFEDMIPWMQRTTGRFLGNLYATYGCNAVTKASSL